jgi:hypothetical protein
MLQAVILARGSGAVTVSCIKTLKNLLGNQPEWFEPAPCLSSVHNGGFLGLEVRLIITFCFIFYAELFMTNLHSFKGHVSLAKVADLMLIESTILNDQLSYQLLCPSMNT